MEYRILNLPFDADDATDEINALAADGWELMQVLSVVSATIPAYHAVLRRSTSEGFTPTRRG